LVCLLPIMLRMCLEFFQFGDKVWKCAGRCLLQSLLEAGKGNCQGIGDLLKRLHSAGVLKCTVGKYSGAYVA